jgi:hypothetical protein
MLIENIKKRLESYPEDITSLIESVLELEQQYISFQLRTNDSGLKEIKNKIRDKIAKLTEIK